MSARKRGRAIAAVSDSTAAAAPHLTATAPARATAVVSPRTTRAHRTLARIRKNARLARSLLRIQIAQGLQYRAAALSGIPISLFFTLVEVLMITIFYRFGAPGSGERAGLTMAQCVSYEWIAQAIFGMQVLNLDGDLVKKIDSGDIGIELCRPADLHTQWLAHFSAGRVAPMLYRALPVVLVGALIPGDFGLGAPSSVAGVALMLVSLACAFVLVMCFATFAHALRLKVDWGNGPIYIILFISTFLSGAYFPLQLWPDWARTFLYLQPFAGYTDIPVRLYVGSLAPGDALPFLTLQVFWTAVFYVAGRVAMRRRLRTITVQGG